jgi:Transcriptional regulators
LNGEIFQSTSRSTMGDEVFEQFVRLLSSGEFKPGEKLPTEAEMCDQLQVSRPVLREVMRALRYMGYLESVQGGGTYISNPLKPVMSDLKMKLAFEQVQLLEIWELRYVLEVAIAGMAAERATEEETERIWNAYLSYESNADSDIDPDQIIASTQSFHNTVAEAVHNSVLMGTLENVSGLLRKSRIASIQVEGSSARAAHFHKGIAEAIVKKDVEQAQEAMREHLLDVKKDLLAYLEKLDAQEGNV